MNHLPVATTWLAAVGLGASMAWPGFAAPADAAPQLAQHAMEAACRPLFAALRLARAQPVVSQFVVDAGLLPVNLQPVAYRVGDLLHEMEDGHLVVRPMEPGRDPLVDALEAELAQGRAWCRAAGAETYHGVAVRRVQFHHPELESHHQPTTVLIDAARGLPLWHGYASSEGGFAWVYGAGPLAFPPASTLQVQP